MQTYSSGKFLTLTQKLNPGDTSLYGDRDVGVTKGRLYAVNGNQVEWVQFTSVAPSGVAYVYGGLTRGLSQTADPSTASTGQTWLATQQFILVAMHDQLLDKLEPQQIIQVAKTYSTTAARDAALGANGAAAYDYADIKVVATGLFYNYNLSSGQWEVQGTGTSTPNSSTTVSGSVEIAIDSEITSGAGTGGTGAVLSVTPTQLKKSISLKNTATAIAGSNEIVVNVSGEDKRVTWTNTEAQLVTDLPVSTSNLGFAKMATDAIALTGTDETTYVNPKQAKYNYGMLSVSVTSSYNLATTSGTQTITHSLGRTPKNIRIDAYSNLGSTVNVGSIGNYNTNTATIWHTSSSNDSGTDSTNIILVGTDSSLTNQKATISGITSTQFTLNWTKTGSTSGVAYLLITVTG